MHQQSLKGCMFHAYHSAGHNITKVSRCEETFEGRPSSYNVLVAASRLQYSRYLQLGFCIPCLVILRDVSHNATQCTWCVRLPHSTIALSVEQIFMHITTSSTQASCISCWVGCSSIARPTLGHRYIWVISLQDVRICYVM